MLLKMDLQNSPASVKIAGMYVWQHKNGRWYINYGRGKNKSLGKIDKPTADKILERKQKEVLEGKLFILSKKQLLLINGTNGKGDNGFKKEYLATRTGQAANTYRADELALDTFIEFYGNRAMAGITEPVMLRYRAHLKKGLNLADNSANNYMRHLRGAIKYAMKHGYTPLVIDGKPNSPLDGLKQYRVDHGQKIWLEKEDALRVIETSQNHPDMKTVVPVMFYTGIPRQNVVMQVYVTPDSIQYRRGKTKKLITVPICDELRPYVAHLSPGIHQLAHMHPDTVSDKLSQIFDEAEIREDFTTHKIRHTFASLMLRMKVPIEWVSKWLGHSDIRITLKFYGDLVEKDGVEQMKKFSLK